MVFKILKIRKSDFASRATIREDDESLPYERNEELWWDVAMYAVMLFLSVVCATLVGWAVVLRLTEREPPPVVSCYYDTPEPDGAGQLLPADIHPRLCTHINVAFARVRDDRIHLQEHQRRAVAAVVALKRRNPALKVLLSVGGAGGRDGFADMVFNHTSRKTFIRSIKDTLRNLSLDGVDLDWEFPAVEYQNVGTRERQHFSQLLREIRMEYRRERRGYLLTVAAAAPQIIVDAAYDVQQLDLYVDYVNIMSYDFHAYTRFTPLTGLNAPLFARRSEGLYLATLNVDYTVRMYEDKGLRLSKIVVGIPTYGHSFTLVNEENTKVGSPALGFGNLGRLGFVDYPDICKFLSEFRNETTVEVDSDAEVPFFYRNAEWVSYDDPNSVAKKAEFIRKKGLRGAMIYSLNADDYAGACGDEAGPRKFPLVLSVKNTLLGPNDN